MKYICFLTVLIIFACGSSQENQQPKPGSASDMSAFTKEDIDRPVLGGPADFTVTAPFIKQNGTVRLIGFYLDQNYLADTSSMKNGSVRFRKPEGYAQGFYAMIFPDQTQFQLMLGDDQEFEITVASPDIVSSTTVVGDIENELYYEASRYERTVNSKSETINAQLQALQKGTPEYDKFLARKREVDGERMARLQEICKRSPDGIFAKFKLGGQNPQIRDDLPEEQKVAQYRRDFWDLVDLSDRRLLRTPMLGNKLNRYMTELTPQNPDSIIATGDYLLNRPNLHPELFQAFSNWIVKKFEPTKCTLMDPEAVFVHNIQNYFTFEKAFWSDSLVINTLQQRAFEMAQSLVGADAPNVVSTDQYGKKQELLASDKDYIIVYMFNPDCEHCQEQTPKLIQYYNQHKNEVDVFAIAIETEAHLWKAYVDKLKFPFRTVYDPTNRSIYAKYYVDITPELYLINKERKIIGKNLKVFQIDTIIDRDKANKKR